jgi:hypothetical protein
MTTAKDRYQTITCTVCGETRKRGGITLAERETFVCGRCTLFAPFLCRGLFDPHTPAESCAIMRPPPSSKGFEGVPVDLSWGAFAYLQGDTPTQS